MMNGLVRKNLITMKKFLYLGFFLVFTVSCNNNSKLAENLLKEAQTYYESQEYANAKLYLDSLKLSFPKEAAIQKERLQLMRLIELKEYTRNLNYCDSMLIIYEAKADSLKKNFLFEKDKNYDEIGKYLLKQQKTENNLQKTYIRCHVNEYGELILESVYYGSNPINHTKIKVSSPTGEYTETESIPRDGGLNYAFQDFGAVTEIVTYKKEKNGSVIQFICDNHNGKLKVEYIGSKTYSTWLTPVEKNAVIRVNELATVLSDIDRLKKEIQKAQSRIEYLKAKIPEREKHINANKKITPCKCSDIQGITKNISTQNRYIAV